MTWQPISTVPKDGTIVLLHQDGTVRAGAWVDTSYESEELVEKRGNQRVYEIVRTEAGHWTCDDIYDPTHWMPLPEPPTEGV